MTTKQSEAILLSLLGPRPVFWHDAKFNEIFCAWNGICMTQNHALMLASDMFWKQPPTPEMKRIADRHLFLLYNSGAFENSKDWKSTISNYSIDTSSSMHGYYKRMLTPHIIKELSQSTPIDVFKWFNLKEWIKE